MTDKNSTSEQTERMVRETGRFHSDIKNACDDELVRLLFAFDANS